MTSMTTRLQAACAAAGESHDRRRAQGRAFGRKLYSMGCRRPEGPYAFEDANVYGIGVLEGYEAARMAAREAQQCQK